MLLVKQIQDAGIGARDRDGFGQNAFDQAIEILFGRQGGGNVGKALHIGACVVHRTDQRIDFANARLHLNLMAEIEFLQRLGAARDLTQGQTEPPGHHAGHRHRRQQQDQRDDQASAQHPVRIGQQFVVGHANAR